MMQVRCLKSRLSVNLIVALVIFNEPGPSTLLLDIVMIVAGLNRDKEMQNTQVELSVHY